MLRSLGSCLLTLVVLSIPVAARGADGLSGPSGAPVASGGAVAAAPRVKFVVVQPSHTDKIPPDVVLHRTVDLIAARLVEVVGEGDMSEEQKACGDESCLRSLLKSSGATHAIVLRFDPPDANFISHGSIKVFSVVDSAYYASSISDTFSSATDFEKRIAQDAATLVDQVVARAKMAKAPPPLTYRPLAERLWPWALVGGGVVAAGWGVYLIAEDGHGNCDQGPCPYRYATTNRGIAFLAGGAAAAIVGGLLEYKFSQPISVAVGPSSVALSGQF